MEEKKLDLLMLTVKVRLEQAKDKELPEVMVYAFDRTGQFLTSAPLPKGEKGEVKLEFPPELQGTTVRVLLGPPLAEKLEERSSWMTALMREDENEGQKKVPSPAVLVRKGVYEKRVRLHTERETLNVAIFPHDWTKWLLCPCVVRGRLVKYLTLPDGTTKDLGVCNACVKIYEVDKFPKLILRLPERDLFRLRDDLRAILEKWPPEPLPKEFPPELKKPRVWPPPPPPVHRGALGSRLTIRQTKKQMHEVSALGPQPEPPDEPLWTEMPAALPKTQIGAELEPVFMATSATQLRSALIVKADILVQLACLWEWLHFYFHTDLIEWCVCTDEQGRFETTIEYPCGGDKPDLYFKAVQCIDCALHTIYDPGIIACHTYWNYECGSEVVLVVTDPAAKTCVSPEPVDPPPGVTTWVMPYAVGNIPLNQIKPIWQKNLEWHVIDVDPTKHGLTDYGDIMDAPFGSPEDSRLGFRHGYSSVIPMDIPNKPFYYRWRYKKDGKTNWHDFSETVVRHYVKEQPGKLPTYPVCTLGPKALDGKHLYRFKQHDPSDCDDFISGGHNYWPTDDWFADIHSGFLDTYGLPGGVNVSAGRYKIKLEIYDKDGNRVAPGPGTFQFIVPTGVAADGVTIETREATSAEIEDDGFVFDLHIDNRDCIAIIDAPTISGIGADPECGFLRYLPGDPVRIAFHALHQANYATFDFWIKRAANTISDVSGEVAAGSVADMTTDPPDHSYVGDGSGNFHHDFLMMDRLLGSCTEAAFAEILRVHAKATNGWRRLWEYDSHNERAFTLAPKTNGGTE